MREENLKLKLLDNLNNAISNLTILMGEAIDKKEFNEAKKYAEGLDKICREFKVTYNNAGSYLVDINIALNNFEEASKWFKICCEDILINNFQESKYFSEELIGYDNSEEIIRKEAKSFFEKDYVELENYKEYKEGKESLKKYLKKY
ncbi:MAG: hypothetical protein ACRC30_12880 [Clostridium sp.]